MDIDRYLLKLRNTNTPTVLRTVDRKAVIKFYNAFADFLQQYKVPIKTFDQLRIVHLDDPATTVYPDSLYDFTARTRYEITGYNGQVTRAASEGYAHVRNHATHTIDKILFVYSI